MDFYEQLFKTYMQNIVNAVYEKTGETYQIPLKIEEIADKIRAIPQTGAAKEEEQIAQTITENGDYIITPTAANTVISQVNLTIDVPSAVTPAEPNLQEKTLTITSNGSQQITADSSYDGLSAVTVNVNVPLSQNIANTHSLVSGGYNGGNYTIWGDWDISGLRGDNIAEYYPTPLEFNFYGMANGVIYQGASATLTATAEDVLTITIDGVIVYKKTGNIIDIHLLNNHTIGFGAESNALELDDVNRLMSFVIATKPIEYKTAT